MTPELVQEVRATMEQALTEMVTLQARLSEPFATNVSRVATRIKTTLYRMKNEGV